MMLEILRTNIHFYNLGLLMLSAVVCGIATCTALRLMIFGGRSLGRRQSKYLLAGGACGGAGAWATHFIALLAFQPGMPTAFDVGETFISLVIAIVAGSFGVLLSFRTPRPWNIPVWGLVFCAGLGATQYVGIAALRVPGTIAWQPVYVAASIIAGGLFSMLSLRIALQARSAISFLLASACMALAICSLHFISIAAIVIKPDPSILMSPRLVSNGLVAIGVAATAIFIALVGLSAEWLNARVQQSSLKLLRQIIEASPHPLAYYDANDLFVLGNQAYGREMALIGLNPTPGFSHRTVLEHAAEKIVAFNTAERILWIDSCLQTRAAPFSAFDQRMCDGRFLRIHYSRTTEGGVVTVISDITGLSQQAEELAAARDQSEAATRAKSAFLATMSHEIRTPLNGVLGMAQAMAFDELSPTQFERVKVIMQSGEALLAVLNDVLDISKIEAGKLELETIEFELGEMVRSVYGALTVLARSSGLELVLDFAPNAEGRYTGDPTRIRQIIYNLFSNGIKFTADGEVRLSVDFSEDILTLKVSDTGIGMSPDQSKALFQKFVQADASTTRRFGGTGLGLAISQELAELMGGKIEVTTALGLGSAFALVLPLEKLKQSNKPLVKPVRIDPQAFALRVLAAEDNPINRLVLQTLLSQVGIEPVMVENGAEALAAWSRESWDLILMDVQMPIMDGPEATRQIRLLESIEGRVRTPIIALTANAMVHQVDEYLLAGMDTHVAKPIETSHLFAAIQLVLDADQEVTDDDEAVVMA